MLNDLDDVRDELGRRVICESFRLLAVVVAAHVDRNDAKFTVLFRCRPTNVLAKPSRKLSNPAASHFGVTDFTKLSDHWLRWPKYQSFCPGSNQFL